MKITSYFFFTYFKVVIIFSFVFHMSNTPIIGQIEKTSNWQEKLSKVEGQERVDLILELAKEIAKTNFSLADSLAREGIVLARQMGDSLSVHKIGMRLGNMNYIKNELEEGFKWTRKSLNYFEQYEELSSEKAKAQLLLASLYIRKRDYVKADSLILESESSFPAKSDLKWKRKILATKGSRYMREKNYEKAEAYFVEELNVNKQSGDNNRIAGAMSNIGLIKEIQGLYPEALELQLQALSMDCSDWTKTHCCMYIGRIYRSLKDWEPAEKYTQMSIELNKKLGYEKGLSSNYANLGIIQNKQLNYGEALKYYEKSLAIKRKYNLDVGSALATIGNTYNLLGEPEKADEYYSECLELAEAINDWEGMWLVNHNRGFYHFSNNQYDKALTLFLASYEIAKENDNLPFLKHSNEMLGKVYDKLGDEKKAKFYEGEFAIINDSLIGAKRIKKIGALEQKHLAKHQEDSLSSNNQSDANTNKVGKPQNSLKMVAELGLIALILFFFFKYIKKYRKQDVDSTDLKPTDSKKIDLYFEELFARLDKNEMTPESNNNYSSRPDVEPVNDMSVFLKENLSTTDGWASFEKYFEKVHKDFFKDLKISYPSISINELNMCALLKLNLRNKDIAQIMGVSHDSVRKAQNRLSKKLEIPEDDSLRNFVLKM